MRAFVAGSAPEIAARPRLGERLVDAGIIAPAALERALEHQKTSGGRLGECLVELDLLSEHALLRFLATEYRTQFVSAEKLARTPVAPEVLDRLPVRMAERQALIPILFDAETSSLSVVMAEPQNLQVLEEVRFVAGVQEVHAYIALRSAVMAAVRRHYYGDTSAFEQLGAPARGDLGPLVDYYAHGAASARAPEHLDSLELARVLMGQAEARRRELRFHAMGVAAATRVLMEELGAGPEERDAARLAAYVHELGKRPDRHLTLLALQAAPELRADAKRMVRAPVRLLERAALPALAAEILVSLYEAFDGSGLPEGRARTEIPLGARVIAAADACEDLRHGAAGPGERSASPDEVLATLQRESGKLFDPQVLVLLARYMAGDLLRARLASELHPVLWLDPAPDPVLLAGLRARGLPVLTVGTAAAARPILAAGFADLALCTVSPGRADGMAPALELRPLLGTLPLVLVGGGAEPASIERGLRLGAADFVSGPLDPAGLATRLLKLLADRQVPPRPVHGSLDELALPELLRTLARSSARGLLALSWFAGTVELWLAGGRIVYARAGGITGERALALLADVERADVRFDPEVAPPASDLDREVESVLAARAGDGA